MPLARGRVLTTLASDYESTKIVNMGGEIGTLTQDRLTAVMGRLGAKPPDDSREPLGRHPGRREAVPHGDDLRSQADAASWSASWPSMG